MVSAMTFCPNFSTIVTGEADGKLKVPPSKIQYVSVCIVNSALFPFVEVEFARHRL